MKQGTKSKGTGTWVLPVVAVIMVVIMLIVVFFIPKGTDTGKSETDEGTASQTSNDVSGINEDGDLVIYADRLSPDEVSFIRLPGNSRIELLARSGDDGTVNAALGTCQSCNGSPGAYYTQKGSELVCNNCGLTFPISVLDSPGSGCHPIMIDEGILKYEGSDLVIDLEGLSAYEELFAKVADH